MVLVWYLVSFFHSKRLKRGKVEVRDGSPVSKEGHGFLFKSLKSEVGNRGTLIEKSNRRKSGYLLSNSWAGVQGRVRVWEGCRHLSDLSGIPQKSQLVERRWRNYLGRVARHNSVLGTYIRGKAPQKVV